MAYAELDPDKPWALESRDQRLLRRKIEANAQALGTIPGTVVGFRGVESGADG